jgi:hypothetical protein
MEGMAKQRNCQRSGSTISNHLLKNNESLLILIHSLSSSASKMASYSNYLSYESRISMSSGYSRPTTASASASAAAANKLSDLSINGLSPRFNPSANFATQQNVSISLADMRNKIANLKQNSINKQQTLYSPSNDTPASRPIKSARKAKAPQLNANSISASNSDPINIINDQSLSPNNRLLPLGSQNSPNRPSTVAGGVLRPNILASAPLTDRSATNNARVSFFPSRPTAPKSARRPANSNNSAGKLRKNKISYSEARFRWKVAIAAVCGFWRFLLPQLRARLKHSRNAHVTFLSSKSAEKPENSSIQLEVHYLPHQSEYSRYEAVDNYAINAPKQKTTSIPLLAGYLVKQNPHCNNSAHSAQHNSTAKIRSIYRWICEHIGYSTVAGVTDFLGNLLTDPGQILTRRRANAQGFANLFCALAEYCAMDCLVVGGVARGAGWSKIGQKVDFSQPNHWWNVVRLENQWITIDCCWSSGYSNNNSANIIYNPTIKGETAQNNPPPKFTKHFSNAYFKCPPNLFILQHFPLTATNTRGKLLGKSADFAQNPVNLQLLGLEKSITKQQFDEQLHIDRAYIEFSLQTLQPLNSSSVNCSTPTYSLIFTAPQSLEFNILLEHPQLTAAQSKAGYKLCAEQCYNLIFHSIPDDLINHKVEIQFIFPYRGVYYTQLQCKRAGSSQLHWEDVLQCKLNAQSGVYDIRKDQWSSVFVGFLQQNKNFGNNSSNSGISAHHPNNFQIIKPNSGVFDLGNLTKLSISTPNSVVRVVAANNGNWIELREANNSSSSGYNGKSTLFEGEIKLNKFPDLQIFAKFKGESFNLIYSFGLSSNSLGNSGNFNEMSNNSASSYSTERKNVHNRGKSIIIYGQNKPNRAKTQEINSDLSENKEETKGNSASSDNSENHSAGSSNSLDLHGRVLIDSRGTIFDRDFHLLESLRLGRRSCALQFEVAAGTIIKAELRAGWKQQTKLPENSVKIIALDNSGAVTTHELTATFPTTGNYSIHIFLSAVGNAANTSTSVFRFAACIYLNIQDTNKSKH